MNIIKGWKRFGSVGDLHIKHLRLLRLKGNTRVWVIGYFDNKEHHLDFKVDNADHRSELLFLGLQLIWQYIRSIPKQVKIYF